MNPQLVPLRRVAVLFLLCAAFSASVFYDTRYIAAMEGTQSKVGAAIVACFAVTFILIRYSGISLQHSVLAAWPIHLYTAFLIGFSWCFHGGAAMGTIVAYTIVAYSTWLLIPMWMLTDRWLFDNFIKILAFGSALLAIPSFIGAIGIDAIMGVPLSNKYSYSSYSGMIASGGIFEHAEGHALQMGIGFLCSYYWWRRLGGFTYASCTAMTAGGLIVSQGRGALFGVMIAAAFYLLPALFRRSRTIFLTSVTTCLVFPFLIWPLLSGIPGVSGYLRMERGLSGRDVAWLYAINLVEEKPWVGHGFGTSGELSEEAHKHLRKSGYSGAGTTFHNTFITKSVELGVLVTLVYATLYLVPLIQLCKSTDDELTQHLIRAVVLLTLTASIFRDYNIGGVRSTSMLAAVFLGLANLWPYASVFSFAWRSRETADAWSPNALPPRQAIVS